MAATLQAGFFGKLPVRGDFVGEGLPRDFVEPWDAWLQRGLTACRRFAGESWTEAWLEAPVWRFVLPPGLCGRQAALGLWLPSVDRANRYFPLTIAALRADPWMPDAPAALSFLDAAEELGRDAIARDLTPAEVTVTLGAMPDNIETGAPSDVLLWTAGGPRVPAGTWIGAALPEDAAFARLIDGDWANRP
jgi:type VI secretion system protein ImpM